MNIKLYMTVCITVLLLVMGFAGKAEAKDPNVTDWLNQDKEHKDEDDQTPIEDNSDQNEQTTDVGKSGSLIFNIVKMVFALLLILALIYLLLQFLKKRNKLFHQIRSLENLGGISVGQNKSIQMVRVGSKVYMVGVGENVEMLKEITDEEVKRELLHRDENQANEFSASNLLPSFLQAKTGGQNGLKKQSKADFKHHFSNELEKLKENRKNMIEQHKQKEDQHE